MGSIVAAALVAHVPTLMLPEATRLGLGAGRDTSLLAGLRRLRERLDACSPDALLIVDTHWFTTTEHVVAGAEHHRGVYTSEELPRVIADLEFDYPGAPELAKQIAGVAHQVGVRVTNVTAPHLAHHYPTLNLVHHLHRGERVLSTGVCQTADADDFLAFGAVVAEAVAEVDSRVAVLASGGMSHRFWGLRDIPAHSAFGPEHVITPEARAFDERVLTLWADGGHGEVIDLWPDYRAHSPEGGFGHYLTMAGALGGRSWRAPGVRLSDYENSLGTGQAHVWFEL